MATSYETNMKDETFTAIKRHCVYISAIYGIFGSDIFWIFSIGLREINIIPILDGIQCSQDHWG